jgi:hypothetical protein
MRLADVRPMPLSAYAAVAITEGSSYSSLVAPVTT